MGRKYNRLNDGFGRTPHNAFYQACRNTIFIECIVKCKREKMYKDGYTCALTGRFHQGDCQLHHEGVRFGDIVAQFKIQYGYNEHNTKVISRGSNLDGSKLFFKDTAPRLEFVEFHNRCANLVPVHPVAHLFEHAGLHPDSLEIYRINFL